MLIELVGGKIEELGRGVYLLDVVLLGLVGEVHVRVTVVDVSGRWA